MVERTIPFEVRLPGWVDESGEIRLAVWEGEDGNPDQRFWLPAGAVDRCVPVGRRWGEYELYDVKINVSSEMVRAAWESGFAQTAYSVAAAALYMSMNDGMGPETFLDCLERCSASL